jgi:sugar O-acyltransferase (sialic acid O-acetyltransferase NeuD family)
LLVKTGIFQLSPTGTECAQTSPFASLVLHDLPPSVRRIIVVGAGGFGREVLLWARDAWPGHASKIAGFLSAHPAMNPPAPLPVIADPAVFTPLPGDGLLLAIGIPYVLRRVAEDLSSRGALFLTLVHPTVVLAPTATIGVGAILCPYAIVSDSCVVGRCSLLNFHSSLGHDSQTGDYSVLSPHATLAGGARIGDDVFLGVHASVGPGIDVGSGSAVAANSCALASTSADALVFGVPGNVRPRVRPEQPQRGASHGS